MFSLSFECNQNVAKYFFMRCLRCITRLVDSSSLFFLGRLAAVTLKLYLNIFLWALLERMHLTIKKIWVRVESRVCSTIRSQLVSFMKMRIWKWFTLGHCSLNWIYFHSHSLEEVLSWSFAKNCMDYHLKKNWSRYTDKKSAQY